MGNPEIMNAKRYGMYWVETLALTLVFLPIALQVGGFALTVLQGSFGVWNIVGLILVLFPAGAVSVFRLGKKADLPDGFAARYGPFLAPIIYASLAWIIVSLDCGGDFSKGWNLFPWFFWPFVAYLGVAFLAAFSGDIWTIPAFIVVSQMVFAAVFAFGTWRGGRFAMRENRHAAPMLSLALLLTAVSGVTTWVQYHSVFREDPAREVKDEFRLWRHMGRAYDTFDEHGEFVRPRQTPSLLLGRDHPRLDGATALLPIYGAAARAIYVRESGAARDARKDTIQCTNTPSAYQRLISGETDMIFVAAPSEEQKKRAAEHGLVLTLTPIAREAFVFLIHERNPVKNLSVDEIRAIYGGKINDWGALGSPAGKILAFQRNPDSGSQTAMERLVMQGAPMRKPLEAEYHGSMGGIIRAVADYRNYANALGYSFRYYATAMNEVPEVGLLSVNGVAPTAENIRNGAYPFISEAYIVTARPLSENAQRLRDWFLSDEGQQLIADVGYVPIRPADGAP
jgi:phosphate transport system substrate-binding protein